MYVSKNWDEASIYLLPLVAQQVVDLRETVDA